MIVLLVVVVMKTDDVEENDVRGDDNSDDNDDNQLRKHQIGITQAKPFYLPLWGDLLRLVPSVLV